MCWWWMHPLTLATSLTRLASRRIYSTSNPGVLATPHGTWTKCTANEIPLAMIVSLQGQCGEWFDPAW